MCPVCWHILNLCKLRTNTGAQGDGPKRLRGPPLQCIAELAAGRVRDAFFCRSPRKAVTTGVPTTAPPGTSEDEEASEDYRRFCLGTLGALEELPDDDADDEEYYYLHDKEYVRESQRGMFSDLEDEDEDGFEYHPARVSKSELHDLIADKKRGQETHGTRNT